MLSTRRGEASQTDNDLGEIKVAESLMDPTAVIVVDRKVDVRM